MMSINDFLDNEIPDLHLEEMLMVLNTITINKDLPEADRVLELGCWFSPDGLSFSRILDNPADAASKLVISLDAFGKLTLEVDAL
ncbi:hypothetical protein [Megalodesulfovibrio gigas]|uniref:Uncharacterized protein n=1 Tax=Megalodesulfovibrio gigas (strain ATCC 19364 / DSM 1382 / NCIMB 9332 / VKM B-1759) TaxID=1121448 RepID=T2GC83_MEGG1|nr:hypothetical protein [Megalodesulfovibrio gigas]AGW13913.1 hypothetical protein DGI_2152 [Megalodesulfovibrio gigas DSM 1382 = ATCC 19364]